MSGLFDGEVEGSGSQRTVAPLAERLRPTEVQEFVGQEHLLGAGKPIRQMLDNDELASMILWGPPGTGKTSLARLIAGRSQAQFFQLNAVSSGVKEVRDAISKAGRVLKLQRRRTILFIDEIHRFNKAQQDALLHSVEDGTITLIGATTENPSFEVISPLLSRCQVYVLNPLGKDELDQILSHALENDPVMRQRKVTVEDRGFLMLLSGGDARRLLNGLEAAVRLTRPDEKGNTVIRNKTIEEAFQRSYSLYDKTGEQHYDIISAFIKSLRGSDPDGAIYWLARMLDGGEDIRFIARRMVILSSEDIGNADPYALVLATACFSAVDSVGLPEARIILAQAAAYLAAAPKSNASYLAIEQAMADVQKFPNLTVPLHLRNAPTTLMKDLGYGSQYKYSHDYEDHFKEQQYLPDNIKGTTYYHPTEQGKEKEIRDRLKKLWQGRKGT